MNSKFILYNFPFINLNFQVYITRNFLIDLLIKPYFIGKVEAGETVVEGAIREMKEECGVTIHKNDLKFKGFFTFNLVPCDQIHRIHVFTAEKFEGEIIETEVKKL